MEEKDQIDPFFDVIESPKHSFHEIQRDYETSEMKPNHQPKSYEGVGNRPSSDSDGSSHYSTGTETDSASQSFSYTTNQSKRRSTNSLSGSNSSFSSVHTSSSGSRSAKKSVKTSALEVYSRCRSRSSESSKSHKSASNNKSRHSDKYSSPSTSSDDGNTNTSSLESQRQAWGEERKNYNRNNNRIAERPKTAVQKSSKISKYHMSQLSQDRNKDATDVSPHQSATSDTDSDITDVSPIISPRNRPTKKHSGTVGVISKAISGSKMCEDLPDEKADQFSGGEDGALRLNLLMKAVSELDRQKRVNAKIRRVMFEPQRSRHVEKDNYTFNNEDTHRIEQENNRLLKEIMRRMQTRENKRQAVGIQLKQAVLTPSAVNRRRDQKRIEQDNLALLQRLQNIRASKGISRREQLKAYSNTVLHGVPIATLHPDSLSRTGGGSGRASSGILSVRTRSLSSLHGTATPSSVSTFSHQSSSRPSSAKRFADRPPWSDRW